MDDQVKQYRELQYLKRKWFPEFVEYMKTVNNAEITALKSFTKKIKEEYLFEAHYNNIPGRFRKRLILHKTTPTNSFSEYQFDDDIEMQIAMMESMQIDENCESVPVCIDLRIYGNNPDQPVNVNGINYYLDLEQQRIVINEWKKVDPESNAGINFVSNLEYHFSKQYDRYDKMEE